MGFDFDVRHSDLIWCKRLKLLLQPVLSHHRRLTTVSARTVPVADLCGDSGQGCQPRHPGLRDAFFLVAQIASELAIAINPAAVRPGLPDQLGLTHIFLRRVP